MLNKFIIWYTVVKEFFSHDREVAANAYKRVYQDLTTAAGAVIPGSFPPVYFLG